MENTINNYLNMLNAEQREAVCHTGSPLLILAGAGSGKTRVITTKIAWLIAEKAIPPESILAVTFTNKAAREMAERAQLLDSRSNRAIIRTFHSFGAWFLRRYASVVGLSPYFNIYDEEDSTILLMKTYPQFNKQEAQRLIYKISRAKDYCLAFDDPLLKTIDPEPSFATIYHEYQNRLHETGNVDFGDLIMLPVYILKNHPTIAGFVQKQFSVILVDEYQDSNNAQFQLLKHLACEQTDVCVVGDDDQSIYRFRGAEIQNILTFDRYFKQTKIIRLERNYRSYGSILRVANSIIMHNQGRLGKTLIADRGESPHKPFLYFLPHQNDESELCVQLIENDIANGGHYKDWAILYRTNAQSLSFETAFLHAKIPHKVIGALKFYEREEIKDAIALLALIANERDEIALRRIINKPARGIGEKTQDKLIIHIRQLFLLYAPQQASISENTSQDFLLILLQELPHFSFSKKITTAIQHFFTLIHAFQSILKNSPENETLSAFVSIILEKSGLIDYHKNQDEIMGTQKTTNLQELINTASLYSCNFKGLISFLEHIELDRNLSEALESHDAVHLITMHNTKGLEFQNVIITGLENSIFPRDEENNENLEEERRLMYVACTRAKDRLYMTSCSVRRMYGKLSYMQPSRFLAEIDPALIEIVGKPIVTHTTHTQTITRWQCGKKIYHDDYGYGYIIQSRQKGSEHIITVQFKTGCQMQFFPAYQSHEIFIINE